MSEESIQRCASERRLVKVTVSSGTDVDGCLLGATAESLLLRSDHNWKRDGWTLVLRRHVKRIQERKQGFQDFALRLGLRRAAPRPPIEFESGLRACLCALARHGGLVEIHFRSRTGFWVGRITRVGATSVSVRGVDPHGAWERKLEHAKLGSISHVAWDSLYARAYERMLARSGGARVPRRRTEPLDVRGRRAVSGALRALEGSGKHVGCVLSGRGDREFSGYVVGVGAQHVLLADWDTTKFDGWTVLRRSAITRVRRARSDAEHDERREQLGLAIPKPPFAIRSFDGVLRTLQRQRALCVLRLPGWDGSPAYGHFVRIERRNGWRMWTRWHEFDGSLEPWLSNPPKSAGQVSAILFAGAYLDTYQANLLPKRRARSESRARRRRARLL
ncbi:MAG: hypothetical protein EPO68_02065 [Planctomycetota bacterium]|nr:MAG: hypothetical protein EPO68_02065 [Planctomycetota bacterium]